MTKIASNAWIYSEFGVGVNNSKCPTKSVIEGYGCTVSLLYSSNQLVPENGITYEVGGEVKWVNTNYTGDLGNFVIFKGLLMRTQLDYYVNNNSYFLRISAEAGSTKTYPYLMGYDPVTSGTPLTTKIEPIENLGQVITIATTSGDTASFNFIKGGSSTCSIPDSAVMI